MSDGLKKGSEIHLTPGRLLKHHLIPQFPLGTAQANKELSGFSFMQDFLGLSLNKHLNSPRGDHSCRFPKRYSVPDLLEETPGVPC